MISPKILLYTMMFSCLTFVFTASQGGFIGMMQSPIHIPALLSLGFIAFFLAFVLSMKDMSIKLKIVGLLYSIAGLGMSFVLISPFILPTSGSTSIASTLFLFLYPIGLVMLGTFYPTYFWIAIRAQMTIIAALVLLGFSAILSFSMVLFSRGTLAETTFIGFPGLIVSVIAYFKAKSVIKARATTAQ